MTIGTDVRMNVELSIDNKNIRLNDFAAKMLSGSLLGAVTSLHGVKEDWKEIRVKVTK
jgi:hypothetical protein